MVLVRIPFELPTFGFLLLSFSLFQVVTSNVEDVPEVQTSLGVVRGLWMKSASGRTYASFEGMPYAKPPVGELRFERSVPVEPWPGIWNATREFKCVQPSLLNDDIIGSEDCLYINVYIPTQKDRNLLPVVAHIHGGAFRMGYGQEFLGVKYVMDKGVILVTFNYRLGLLGFLSTEDDVVPGNNGLKDQVLALKWIQAHIRSFGGNPDTVTLTGFSAGGASCHLHYFSPLSKGLFHRGMSTSGNALAPWAIKEKPLRMSRRLAALVGCNLDTTREMVLCLKSRPATQMEHSARHNLHRLYPVAHCPFAPVVETGHKEAFLIKDPYLLLKEGKVHDVPFVTSFTTDDGGMTSLTISDRLKEVYENWPEYMKHVSEAEDAVPEGKRFEMSKKLKDFYHLDVTDDKKQYEHITRLATDRMFRIPAETSVLMQSNVTKSPVYLYWFDFEGANSYKNLLHPNPPPGVFHGDDMVYIFGGYMTKPMTKVESEMQNIGLEFLEQYAKTGVPIFKNVVMEPVKGDLYYYKIRGPDDIKRLKKVDYDAMKLWSTLGFEEGENLLKST